MMHSDFKGSSLLLPLLILAMLGGLAVAFATVQRSAASQMAKERRPLTCPPGSQMGWIEYRPCLNCAEHIVERWRCVATPEAKP